MFSAVSASVAISLRTLLMITTKPLKPKILQPIAKLGGEELLSRDPFESGGGHCSQVALSAKDALIVWNSSSLMLPRADQPNAVCNLSYAKSNATRRARSCIIRSFAVGRIHKSTSRKFLPVVRAFFLFVFSKGVGRERARTEGALR